MLYSYFNRASYQKLQNDKMDNLSLKTSLNDLYADAMMNRQDEVVQGQQAPVRPSRMELDDLFQEQNKQEQIRDYLYQTRVMGFKEANKFLAKLEGIDLVDTFFSFMKPFLYRFAELKDVKANLLFDYFITYLQDKVAGPSAPKKKP